MAPKTKRKKPAKKRQGKTRKQNRVLPALLRQWSVPLFLLLLVTFSLAATFYLIFLHTPAAPIF